MESWKDCTRTPKNAFELARRRTLLRIDLDALTENIAILKSLCSQKTGKKMLICNFIYKIMEEQDLSLPRNLYFTHRFLCSEVQFKSHS